MLWAAPGAAAADSSSLGARDEVARQPLALRAVELWQGRLDEREHAVDPAGSHAVGGVGRADVRRVEVVRHERVGEALQPRLELPAQDPVLIEVPEEARLRAVLDGAPLGVGELEVVGDGRRGRSASGVGGVAGGAGGRGREEREERMPRLSAS